MVFKYWINSKKEVFERWGRKYMKKILKTPTQQTIRQQEDALQDILTHLPYFHTNAVLIEKDVTEQDFIDWKELKEIDLADLTERQLLKLISLTKYYLKYAEYGYFDFVWSQTNKEWVALHRKFLWILAFFDPINNSTNVMLDIHWSSSKWHRVETIETDKSKHFINQAFLKHIRNPLFRRMFLRAQKKL